MDIDAGRELLNTIFNDCAPSKGAILIHSYYFCDKKCRTLSTSEQARNTTKYKFNHAWLYDHELSYCSDTGIHWLVYSELHHGMFCALCRKHKTYNEKNKTSIFAGEAATRFRRAAVQDHAASSQHKAAVRAELLQSVSVFHEQFQKMKSTSDEVLFSAFASCYFLAKQEISNRKLVPLLEFLELIGLKQIGDFQHRSEHSLRQIFTTIGETIKESVVERVTQAGLFGILADDGTDISVMEQMIVFISYINQSSSKVQVDFLTVADVLEDESAEGANAEVLCKVLLSELDKCGLEASNFMSLVTDGASVMTGRIGGLAARLKKVNNLLISIHCICHRLSLACVRSQDDINYISTVETILRQLWQYFENSPKRSAKYLKMQLSYKKATNISSQAEKIVVRKVRKSCRTRWLSLDRAVEGVYLDFVPLLLTLHELEERDAIACGLLKRMKSLKFVGGIYILREILPILSTLSRTFQQGTINFTRISPALKATKFALDEVVNSERVGDLLKSDLADNGRLAVCEIKATTSGLDAVATMLKKYVEALKKNIDDRFQDSLPILSSFRIFNPEDILEDELASHGNEEIRILSNHFFPTPIDKAKVLAEWANFKFELLEWRSSTQMSNAKVSN